MPSRPIGCCADSHSLHSAYRGGAGEEVLFQPIAWRADGSVISPTIFSRPISMLREMPCRTSVGAYQLEGLGAICSSRSRVITRRSSACRCCRCCSSCGRAMGHELTCLFSD